MTINHENDFPPRLFLSYHFSVVALYVMMCCDVTFKKQLFWKIWYHGGLCDTSWRFSQWYHLWAVTQKDWVRITNQKDWARTTNQKDWARIHVCSLTTWRIMWVTKIYLAPTIHCVIARSFMSPISTWCPTCMCGMTRTGVSMKYFSNVVVPVSGKLYLYFLTQLYVSLYLFLT